MSMTATIEVQDGQDELRRCQCQKCIEVRNRVITLPPKSGCNRVDVRYLLETIVHWGERDREDPYWQILITCYKCGHDSFVHKQSIKNSSWHQLCPDCISKHGLPKKLVDIEPLDSGAKVDWSAPTNNPRRRVVYCKNFDTCGHTVERRIDAGNKNKQPFLCDECLTEFRRNQMAGAWAALSSGQKIGGIEKRKRGRKSGDKYIDPKTSRTALESAIKNLRAQGVSISDITYPEVAKIFHRNGEQIGADAVRKRFNDCGTNMKWRDFVVSVAS